MEIVWGVGERPETRGVVVDSCAACASLQPHWFCDAYAAVHIQYVNLDRGMYESSFVVCFRCSGRSEVEPSRYHEVLSQEVAANTPLHQGLSQTNPALARSLEAVSAARSAGAPHEMIEHAEAVLFAKRDIGDVLDALSQWETLPDSTRQAVAHKVRGHWLVAGGPERPRTAIQPGMPGWATPTRPASMLRSIDRKIVLVALVVVGFIVAIVVAAEVFQ